MVIMTKSARFFLELSKLTGGSALFFSTIFQLYFFLLVNLFNFIQFLLQLQLIPLFQLLIKSQFTEFSISVILPFQLKFQLT